MPKYYLLDENKNLVEGFDKEGFLALLEQAIEDGSLENIDENSAVASKIKSLLNGTTHNIEFVTEAQYNQLVIDEELVPNTYYFITDDTTLEDLLQLLSNIINGNQVVGEALHSEGADETDFTNGPTYSFDIDVTYEDVLSNTRQIPSTTPGFNELLTKHCYLWIEHRNPSQFPYLGRKYAIGVIPPIVGLYHTNTPVFHIEYGEAQYADIQEVFISLFKNSANDYIQLNVKNIKGSEYGTATLKLCWKPIR